MRIHNLSPLAKWKSLAYFKLVNHVLTKELEIVMHFCLILHHCRDADSVRSIKACSSLKSLRRGSPLMMDGGEWNRHD
jgi:hypothetical protein